jgi:RND family efflux transporter MFP subunit
MNRSDRLILLAVLLFFCTACSKEKAAHRKEVFAETYRVEKQKTLIARSFPGQIRAKNQAVLSSKISGYVTEVFAQEGDTVKKGDRLIAVDDRESKQRVESLVSSLEEAKREQSARGAQATYAEANLKRISNLLKSQAVSRNEYDRVKSEYDVTISTLQALSSRVKSIAAQLEEAKALLSYTEVSAPFDGFIAKRYVDKGAFCNAGNPLVAIDNKNSGYWFEADIDEALSSVVKAGERVLISIPAINSTQKSSISVILPRVSPETRSFIIKCDIQQPDLRSGLFGRLFMPAGEAEKILIQKKSLVQRGELTAVYALDNESIVHFQLIKTGEMWIKKDCDGEKILCPVDIPFGNEAAENDDVWISVISGLRGGEQIIASNLDQVEEGAVLKRRQ